MQDSTFGLDHPVVRCVEELGAALDRIDGVDPMYMKTREKTAALVELTRISSRVQVLLGRVLASSDDVALDDGARSAAAWLAHRTRTSYGPAAAAAGLGEALDGRWRQLGAAVSAGQVNVEQARVIVRALDELPPDLDPELALKAEAHLVAEAAYFDPKKLRILGRKVLEVAAPDVFEDQERRRLEDEERRARETTSLSMRTRGDGTTDIRARVSDAVAARLKTYLEAFTAPRRGHLDQGPDHIDPDTGRRVPHAVRLGHACGALLEALPAQVMPRHGGSATTLVVTLDYDRLRARLGSAELSTGDVISASEAMRLACTADLVPVVLNGDGVPLPGSGETTLRRGTAKGHGHPGRTLPGPRLRPAGLVVRGPPQDRLVPGRADRHRRRRAALPVAPPPGTRPRLRHRVPPLRRRPLPQADIGHYSDRASTSSAVVTTVANSP